MGAREAIRFGDGALEINGLAESARIRVGPIERLCDDICGARVSLRSPILAARSWVEIMMGDAMRLADLADEAYSNFSIEGEWRWCTISRELAIVIRADGRGHFQFVVTLAKLDGERATSSVTLTAELQTAQLPRLAAAIRSFFSNLP